jgi:hypothetical protein
MQFFSVPQPTLNFRKSLHVLTFFGLFFFLLYPEVSCVHPCQYSLLVRQYLNAMLLNSYIFFTSHYMPHGIYNNALLDYNNLDFLAKYIAQFNSNLVELNYIC